MITPSPTLARLVKLKKEEHRFSIRLFILLFNYIVLITINIILKSASRHLLEEQS